MNEIFFLSDLDIGHEKLAVARGFQSGDHMNNTIEDRWRRTICLH